MAKTYIAFIECTFHDEPPWTNSRELNDPESEEEHTDPREHYIAEKDGSKISLIDLRGTRRDYTFKQHGVVEIIGNVAVIIDWQLKESKSMDEFR